MNRRTTLAAVACLLLAAFLYPQPAAASTTEPSRQTRGMVATIALITVHAGDTLWALAGRYCGNHNAWQNLWHGNTIANPNLIYVGQRLTATCTSTSRTSAPASRSNTRTTSTGWVHPLASGARAVSCWGAARDGGTRRHEGVDLPATRGTPIRAVGAGTIAVSSWSAKAGNYVVVNHGRNIYTVYMHLRARTFLKLGTRVAAGQTIGYVGDTGNAAGHPHLHFGAMTGGMWGHETNPAPFLRARGVNVGC